MIAMLTAYYCLAVMFLVACGLLLLRGTEPKERSWKT